MGSDYRLVLACAQGATFAGVAALAVAVNRPEHWQSFTLVGALIGFALLSELLTVDGRGLRISGSFIAIVLAVVTLGPGPAAAVALSGIALDAVRSRPGWRSVLTNATAYATFSVLGGVAFIALEPAIPPGDALLRGLAVVALFLAMNALNFGLVAVAMAVYRGRSLSDAARQILLPLLPSQGAAAALTAMVDMLHLRHGATSVVLAAAVVLVFQHLLRTTMQSVERAELLEERTLQLAGLQVGLVTTVLRTLSLRDKMTARHSAAVARYSREVAREMGLDAAAQETIHTAGLLHDIGKFIFPDDILLSASGLTDEQFAMVKLHPDQGARLVRRLQGFEEVADIIQAHHERMDGRGYPKGLPGSEIPIGSRIISVCDTYDVMTARDSYRETVPPVEAVAELRRVSGTQLDPAVVGAFLRVLAHKGIGFHHHDDADFEAELDVGRLVAAYARPRVAA